MGNHLMKGALPKRREKQNEVAKPFDQKRCENYQVAKPLT